MDSTYEKPHPTKAYMSQMLSGYEKLKATPRPIRAATEKEALKSLRLAKRERKEDFRKALSKNTASLIELPYSPLAPYYLIANGANLCDEYELIPYPQAAEQNAQFFDRLTAEELLKEKPTGVVFALCPNGDYVLLCVDGTVIRFSHEEPVVTARWPSLAQFVADSLNEQE